MKMTPKHNSKVRPHNMPTMSMDGMEMKEEMQEHAQKNLAKGMTSVQTHRGNQSNHGMVDTQYGCKPEPHK